MRPIQESSRIHFGTDGWRAEIAEQFTFANVAIVTHAIARYIVERFGHDKPVVVGYDLRFRAEDFAHHAATILSEYGLTVLLATSWHPTPPIAYAALHQNTAGAFMFTASHNPAEYLGIKFIPEYAGPAMPDITDKIIENVRHLEDTPDDRHSPGNQALGQILDFDPRPDYIAFLKTLVQFDKIKTLSGTKVLYDPIHGTGQGYVDVLLRDCGVHVDTLRMGRDVLFAGVMPEPKSEFLEVLKQRVPAEAYACGLSNDGDADRFGVVEETGQFISANDMVALMFRHLYKNRGFRGAAARSVATSMLIDRLAESYGDVEIIETPVGFKWLGKAMREQDVIIAGEESGGFSILGNIPEKDGILANLLILEMLAYEKKPLSHIVSDMKAEAGLSFWNTYENHKLEEAQKRHIVAELKRLQVGASFSEGLTITQVDHRDGVKLYFGQYDWLVVRPSGTEPMLRLYFEATDEGRLKAIQTAMAKKLVTDVAVAV
jgi:phosphomannomutase